MFVWVLPYCNAKQIFIQLQILKACLQVWVHFYFLKTRLQSSALSINRVWSWNGQFVKVFPGATFNKTPRCVIVVSSVNSTMKAGWRFQAEHHSSGGALLRNCKFIEGFFFQTTWSSYLRMLLSHDVRIYLRSNFASI